MSRWRLKRPIYLSGAEAELLDDVIDLHIVGLRDSKDPMIEDPAINQTISLLEATSMADMEIERLERIREKLRS